MKSFLMLGVLLASSSYANISTEVLPSSMDTTGQLNDYVRISDSEFDTLESPMQVGSIRSCNPSQTSLIRSAEQQVTERVRDAAAQSPLRDLDYVKAHFIVPENRVFQDGDAVNARYTAYLARLTSVFAKMKSESDKGINFECKSDAAEAHCRNGEVQAYVLASMSGRSYPVVYLCSGYFKNLNDVSGAVTTMFHELSHYAADTEDYGLDWWNAKNPDILRGANDAYHYQMFATRDLDSTLKRNIWYWLWPAQPTP